MIISPESTNNHSSTQPIRKLQPSEMVGMTVMSESMDLVRQGLIGKDSMMGANLFNEGNVTYWSKEEYRQWQAYKNEGSEPALQAAKYQIKMREERIEAANDYLAQVYDLATQYSKVEGINIGFTQYLDYQQGERDLPEVAPAELEKVEKFWQEHAAELESLDQAFDRLKAQPKNLEQWLDTRDFPVADSVYAVVDKLKDAWATTRSDQKIDEAFRPVHSEFKADLSSAGAASNVIPEVADGTKFYSGWDSVGLASGQDLYRSWGSTADLLDEAAKEHLNVEQRKVYHEMQVLRKGLYEQFEQRFGAKAGFPKFSMQDIVDNYLSGKPLAMLDNGLMHPMKEEIEKFWIEKPALTLYSFKQQKLDSLQDLNISDYKEIYAASVKDYLRENLEYLLSKKLPSQYNT